MRVLLSILACALLSCGAGVCYAGDSARAALQGAAIQYKREARYLG
jgi:hypothetical protein